ncbi:hypothetical protein D3C72_1882750 [compost metagenome]
MRTAAGQVVALAGDAHQAAHGLDQEVVCGLGGARPRLAKAGDRAVHQARVDPGQRFVVQPHARQGADLVVLQHHVRVAAQFLDQRLAFGRLQVQRDGALAAVGGDEIGAVGGVLALFVLQERGAPRARVVALAGPLDLDDVRAQVGQDLAGPGAGQDAAQVQHFQV